ncbi:MAG: hypothetical protein AAFQ82_08160 [Myxococcota bacterium]
MSGSGFATLEREHLHLTIEETLRVSIASVVHPDGTTSGPKEYFEERESELRGYLENIARQVPNTLAALGGTLGPGFAVELAGESIHHRWTALLELTTELSSEARDTLSVELGTLFSESI